MRDASGSVIATKDLGNLKKGQHQIQWDGKEMKEVTRGGAGPRDVKIDVPGKYIYMNIKGGISRISSSGKELEKLPIAAKMKIDYQVELEQVFEEVAKKIRGPR